MKVRVTQRYSATPERVFDAWLDRKTAGRWLFATAARPISRVRIDARPGGAFQFVERGAGCDLVHAGEYVVIARPRRLVFTLSERKVRVRVEIVPQGRGCELTLVEERTPLEQASGIEGRWAGMLYGLGTMLRERGS
ncbi:MAG TPA: SRPBCC family protein [Burkholderiales bacterium]|jgi:uncharacterized protein YndB with AHSA1/START domain